MSGHGREAGASRVVKRGPGRPPRHSAAASVTFAFQTGDLVLVKWNDGMVYFAKIKRIDYKRQKCVVVFDDKSQDVANFTQIHSVDETTTDIICIKCKKDDSDKPNEIVLCDMCGIGFHQKCHLPNIPASALELSTPWNCSYCQKGVKCPYLTESLDVLQNLLSDDECSGTEDAVDVGRGDLESNQFEPKVVAEAPQALPRKKRGKKPATEVTAAIKREHQKVHHGQPGSAMVHPRRSSSIVTMDCKKSQLLSDEWKPNKSSAPSEDGDSEPVYISSEKSTPEPSPTPPAQPGVKRKKYHHRSWSGSGGHVKKQKRSSVESRTVSVTRVALPVYDNSSAEEMDTSRDSSVCEVSVSSGQGLDSIKEEERLVLEKRPKTLPVSLSIPDEVEPGTPFDKVVKAHHQKVNSPRVSSVEAKELPSWENFADSNLALRRVSSPKQTPQAAATKKSDILFSTDSPAPVKTAPEASSSLDSPPSAFLASPLPMSSSPKQFHHPSPTETPSAPKTDLKTATTNSSSSSEYIPPSPTSLDVGVRGPSLQLLGTSSTPAPVGYSAPVISPNFAGTTRPSSLLVKPAKPAEINNFTPSNQPPQRTPPLTDQPQPIHATNSVASSWPTLPSGVTHPSTISPLSSTTKPVSLPTNAAAPSILSPRSSGVGSQPKPQQQSRPELPVFHQRQPQPQPIPKTSTAIPSNSTGPAIVGGQHQCQGVQRQQVSPGSSSPQEMIKSPRSVQQVPQGVHVDHKSLAVAQTPSGAAVGQQVSVGASRPMSQAPSSSAAVVPLVSVATSRPMMSQTVSSTSAGQKVPIASSRVPLTQQPVVGVNSTRPAPSAPGIQQEQQIVNSPSSGQVPGVLVNQQHHNVQQQVQYIASTRPSGVPGHQHQVVFSQAARPSSVPLQQQHRPLSVPNHQSQAVVVAPPRPSSVPTQQVLMSRSTSQPAVSAPTQHVLAMYSPTGSSTSLQQVVVTQPYSIGRAGGQPTTVFQGCTSQIPTSVLSHFSPATDNSPALQTQRQVQEQNVTVAAKRATSLQSSSSSGEADVIITGVESTNRVIQRPSAVGCGEKVALTGGGERVVLVNSSGEAIPYQAATVSTPVVPGAVVKVVGKTVEMVPAGSGMSTSLPTVSGQSFVSTAALGSQVPPASSVVPVVLASTNSATHLPMSTIDEISTSPVVYRVATDPHNLPRAQTQLVASATQVVRDASVHAPTSLSNTVASTIVAQSGSGQPSTSVIVACVPAGSAVHPVPYSGVSTTKPYAIVNAMPGTTQVPVTSLPHPPKTYSLVSSEKRISGENKLQHREAVQTISKKIGDAFDSGNEQLLVAAFEDAWKRFQANGKQYESPSVKIIGKDPPPPNAEVFTVPGATSRVSLVRQTSTPRMLAPKSSSPRSVQQVIAPPPLSSKEQTSYVHKGATSVAQPVVYLPTAAVASGQQQQPLSHTKVHSSGVFYPSSSTMAENVAVLQRKAVGGGFQRVVVSQNLPSVRHGGSSGVVMRETSESQVATAHHKPRRSSKSKSCARCGKSATYLCSGCHSEWYCGRECQLKAWDSHAEHCKA